MYHTNKRLKLSENSEDIEINYEFKQKSAYYAATPKSSPDERENSDSGFTSLGEVESSRNSQDDDRNSDEIFLSPSYKPSSSLALENSDNRRQFYEQNNLDDETIRDVNIIGPTAPPPANEEDDEYDDEDSSSSVSQLSGLSNLSDCDTEFPVNPWIRKQIISGVSPRELLSQLVQSTDVIPTSVSDSTLWRIIASTLVQPRRQKLKEYNNLEHALELINNANNIIVLTGAGVSVSCGIPDFRSKDGIYSRLSKEYPDLPDPQAMFDIRYFYQDPRPFYKFAREIYPGQFKPSPCHLFIKMLEKKGKLLRNYTQNIDTLEQVAGIKNVIECHGSFAMASCTKCKTKVAAHEIRDDIHNQKIPMCQVCNEGTESPTSEFLKENAEATKELVQKGIMKPDIVFFGEGLPEVFHDTIEQDRDKCDLLIVIGSSLKVRPVAMIPNWLSASVPQILINREPLYHMDTFDINLLGDSDAITKHLCALLGNDWTPDDDIICTALEECIQLLPSAPCVMDVQKTDMKLIIEETKNEIFDKTDIQNKIKTDNIEQEVEADNNLIFNLKAIETQTSSGTIQSPTHVTDTIINKNDNLPSDDEDDSDNEFDVFRDKRKRQSLADRLPDNSYYKLAPRVFIFPGAEVYMNESDEDDTDDDDNESVKSRKEDSTNISESTNNFEFGSSRNSPVPSTSSDFT